MHRLLAYFILLRKVRGRAVGSFYFIYDSPLGELSIAIGPRGVTDLLIRADLKTFLERVRSQSGAAPLFDPARFTLLKSELDGYFRGEPVSFSQKLDLSGSPFERRVWQAILDIPRGQTRSYAWVAQRAGSPGGARAAGGAAGRNPVPIICPCHRVVKADGSIGGYTGGLDIKSRLLMIEGAEFR